MPKMPKQAEAKRDGVINPQNYNFNQILTRKIWVLLKRCESTEVDRRTWLHMQFEVKKNCKQLHPIVNKSLERDSVTINELCLQFVSAPNFLAAL